MRPFNAEEYINNYWHGKPDQHLVVVYRDGTTPKAYFFLSEKMYDESVVSVAHGVSEDHIITHFSDGRVLLTSETERDLFFKP